jgi:hypothetical protein
VAAAAGLLLASAKPAAQLPGLPSTTACEREGAAIVGSKPEILGRGRRSPKKVRNVVPAFPELPSGTRGSGIWIGELLLDAGGKVRHIWTIRQPRITPPLPAFNRAILDAVRHWRFEPFIVASRATPLCLTVTVSIHWPGAPKAPAPPNGPVAAGESSDIQVDRIEWLRLLDDGRSTKAALICGSCRNSTDVVFPGVQGRCATQINHVMA